MKWWHVAPCRTKCSFQKRICQRWKKYQCEEVVVAQHHHRCFQMHGLPKKESVSNLKKINVPNLQKFKKCSMWGDGGGTWSGGTTSHQMWLPEKNLQMLKKMINVRRWWWRSIVITPLPNARLTKKNLQTFFKNQHEEVVVVLLDKWLTGKESSSLLALPMFFQQCEEEVL